jgi:hypothetical protein
MEGTVYLQHPWYFQTGGVVSDAAVCRFARCAAALASETAAKNASVIWTISFLIITKGEP